MESGAGRSDWWGDESGGGCVGALVPVNAIASNRTATIRGWLVPVKRNLIIRDDNTCRSNQVLRHSWLRSRDYPREFV